MMKKDKLEELMNELKINLDQQTKIVSLFKDLLSEPADNYEKILSDNEIDKSALHEGFDDIYKRFRLKERLPDYNSTNIRNLLYEYLFREKLLTNSIWGPYPTQKGRNYIGVRGLRNKKKIILSYYVLQFEELISNVFPFITSR